MKTLHIVLVLLSLHGALARRGYGSGSGSGSGRDDDDDDDDADDSEIEYSTEIINENAFCSDGWEKFRGKCYYFGRADLNFTNARSFCRGVESDLVVVGSNGENKYITEKVIEHKLEWAWLGIEEVNGQWRIVDGEDSIGPRYKNWASRSANPYGCTYIGHIPYVPASSEKDRSSWKSTHCSQDLPFICEKKAEEYHTKFQECKVTGLGAEYMGTVSKTKSGKECLNWEEAVGPERKWLTRVDWPKCRGCESPRAPTPKTKNSCRNPDSSEFGPWCFVDKQGTKEICDVPYCKEENIKTSIGKYGKSEYTFVVPPRKMTYRTAAAFCQSLDAKLLMIDDEKEDMWIAKEMVKLGQRRALLGITDDLWEWEWRTQDGDDFIRWKSYYNWGYREPTTIGGEPQDCNYVDIDFLIDPHMPPSTRKPYWADTTCNTPLDVICEKQLI